MDIITAKTLDITSDYNIFNNIFWRHLILYFCFKKITLRSSLVSVVYTVSLHLKGVTSSKSRLSIRSNASRSYEASGALVWGSTGVFRHEVTRAFVRCAFAMIGSSFLKLPKSDLFIYSVQVNGSRKVPTSLATEMGYFTTEVTPDRK